VIVAELLTIEEAQRLVLERVQALPPERVPLDRAAGRVLVAEATAVVDLPPFPSSAMDGFALRAADTPGRLPVVFRIAAGLPAPRVLEAGESMGIATGGVVPEGADAVIPFEYVAEHDNEIEIQTAVEPGANIRPRGGDLEAGRQVVPAGVRLGSARLGALAAAGVAEVQCGSVPRAAVLVTGTELRRPGEPLGPGEVYEANGVILAAQLESAGASVERLAAVADDENVLRGALARGLEHDVLVTSGGVSVGPHDLVRRTESALGVDEVFWRVAVKPGKPVSFGVRGPTLVFGLPGNPVSSLVGFELFVRPAILALQHHADPLPRFEPGRLAAAAKRSGRRDQLIRARTRPTSDGAVELEPLAGQESHMIATAAGADALLLVPRGEGELAPGSAVRYLRLA
jgi:molybdopterin molybdotransferase